MYTTSKGGKTRSAMDPNFLELIAYSVELYVKQIGDWGVGTPHTHTQVISISIHLFFFGCFQRPHSLVQNILKNNLILDT